MGREENNGSCCLLAHGGGIGHGSDKKPEGSMRRKHPCSGCYHWRGENYNGECCNYIFDVGHRRPCPPGAECTVKRVVKREDRKRRFSL